MLLPLLFICLLYRFATTEDDKQIVRDLIPTESYVVKKYKIIVHTADIKGAGTDANVFIVLTGDKVCTHAYA